MLGCCFHQKEKKEVIFFQKKSSEKSKIHLGNSPSTGCPGHFLGLCVLLQSASYQVAEKENEKKKHDKCLRKEPYPTHSRIYCKNIPAIEKEYSIKESGKDCNNKAGRCLCKGKFK